VAVAAVPQPDGLRSLAASYAWCGAFARRHSENFTVVSWFLPSELRPHFFALYAFCRATDDLGDEASGDRLALLDSWEADIRAAFAGRPVSPLTEALGATCERFAIPADPFLRLIEANRRDQHQHRFETYAELLDYCEYSATPVGQMVLAVLGHQDSERRALSDATCIGLQLANFWQDVAVDWQKGRVYLPQEDLRRFGVPEAQIAARESNDASGALIRFEVDRAAALFRTGRALEGLVERRARTDIRLFRLGGEAILDAIAAKGYNVLTARPAIPRRKKLSMALTNGLRLRLGL
jgi:squalene synthase HpnC